MWANNDIESDFASATWLIERGLPLNKPNWHGDCPLGFLIEMFWHRMELNYAGLPQERDLDAPHPSRIIASHVAKMKARIEFLIAMKADVHCENPRTMKTPLEKVLEWKERSLIRPNQKIILNTLLEIFEPFMPRKRQGLVGNAADAAVFRDMSVVSRW